MAGFSTPSAAGITKLSELIIDANKDWNAKSITNMTQISVGDVVFANNWRLTEAENGIALIDDKGNIIRRWTNG
ncbi:hypothetical protein ES703_108711 [subsurface metagenome]